MERTLLVLSLVLTGALAATTAFSGITDDIDPLDAHFGGASGRSVTVTVSNTNSVAVSGTVSAELTKGRTRHAASAKVSVPAGHSVNIDLILGTITDDINPLDLQLGVVVDDNDPLP